MSAQPLMRAPMLGLPPHASNWAATRCIGLVGNTLSGTLHVDADSSSGARATRTPVWIGLSVTVISDSSADSRSRTRASRSMCGNVQDVAVSCLPGSCDVCTFPPSTVDFPEASLCPSDPPNSAELPRASTLRNIHSVAHNADAPSTCRRFVMLRVGAAGAPTSANYDISRHTNKAPSGRSDSNVPPSHEQGISAFSIRIPGANDPRTLPASSRPLQHKNGTRSGARTVSRGNRARIAASGAA